MLRCCPSFKSAAAVILLCAALCLMANYLASWRELGSIHRVLGDVDKLRSSNSSFVRELVTRRHDSQSDTLPSRADHVLPQGTGSSTRGNWTLTNHWCASNLSAQSVEDVQTFVFFIGYPRSGHSIIASMLDAHRNVILAHEFNLFSKVADAFLSNDHQGYRLNKYHLFNSLYQDSRTEATVGWRSGYSTYNKKGYSLKLNSSDAWQGCFTTLRVIGDKAGGSTSRVFQKDPALFQQMYHILSDVIQVPVRVIHVVRNPFDMIATRLMYRLSDKKREKAHFNSTNQLEDEKVIAQASMGLYREARAVYNMTTACNLTVREIHYADFIHDTRGQMYSMCQFLGLNCTEGYYQMCEQSVYRHVSRTRGALQWSPSTTEFVRTRIIKPFPFFHRYSFETD